MSDSLRPHGLTVARHAPLSMEFSRQEHWSGLPFPSPGESSWLRDRTRVSCIGVRFFTLWATGKPLLIKCFQHNCLNRKYKCYCIFRLKKPDCKNSARSPELWYSHFISLLFFLIQVISFTPFPFFFIKSLLSHWKLYHYNNSNYRLYVI